MLYIVRDIGGRFVVELTNGLGGNNVTCGRRSMPLICLHSRPQDEQRLYRCAFVYKDNGRPPPFEQQQLLRVIRTIPNSELEGLSKDSNKQHPGHTRICASLA